jgi:beta-galactosidase
MNLKIDLTQPEQPILSGHLKMGGSNPSGVEICANNRYLTLGGQPWLPVMGEFHYSRYPAGDWREELLKMKAGGITVAASYVFWIHHEEIEGEFIWTGDKDLRRFIKLCAEVGLYAYPRIGPWAHGECRNGGLPDWVLAKCGEAVRLDAPLYLSYAQRFYQQINHQLDGLLWKDGGPVVGVQLENELIDNAGHIRTLKEMAQEAGIDVPLYTMTGWGPARVPADEVIPLFGGYPDAFWNRDVGTWARECRKQYIFSPVRNDDLIGADLLKRQDIEDLSYLERYPYLTCEVGGGMQVSYHRRPFISGDDVAVPPLTKVGAGSNLPGYYMYHGGSQPLGKLSTLQESQATHYWNDLPVISYDFQAAIREYGQLSEQYHSMRLLHLFLNDFGAQLAPLPAALPVGKPSSLDDSETLRWSVRSDGRRGLIFINNYQRVEPLFDKPEVQFSLELMGGTLQIPAAPVRIPRGAYSIWPFNLDLNGIPLQYATAQLVCQVKDGADPCYIFAERGGVAAEFAFEQGVVASIEGGSLEQGRFLRGLEAGKPVTLRGERGQTARILLLSEPQSLQVWKAHLRGQERIILSPAGLVFDGDRVRLRARRVEDLWFSVFPAFESLPAGGFPEGAFTRINASCNPKTLKAEWRKLKQAGPARAVPMGPLGVAQAPDDADFEAAEEWEVRLEGNALDEDGEVFLLIDYVGDVGRAYLGGRLIADDFYYGRTWEIGLKRFVPEVLEKGLVLKFLPLRRDAPIYIAPEHRPTFGSSDEILELRDIRVACELFAEINLA